MEGLKQKDIENSINLIRGEHVLLDEAIAEFYAIEVKRLNEQVKRNKERFPEDFCFQLTEDEYQFLSQSATLETGIGKHREVSMRKIGISDFYTKPTNFNL